MLQHDLAPGAELLDQQLGHAEFSGLRHVFRRAGVGHVAELLGDVGGELAGEELLVRVPQAARAVDDEAHVVENRRRYAAKFAALQPRLASALAERMPSNETPTYWESMPPSRGPRASDST